MTTRTQFKTNIVERFKNGESSYKISKDEGCSYNAVLRELKRRNVNTGLRFWTAREIEKLKKLYPISSIEKLLKEFPNRTSLTIGSRVYSLGLKKKECKRICKVCGKEFTLKKMHGRESCPKCIRKRWDLDNVKKANDRKYRWLKRNPQYMREYAKRPKVRERINRYFRDLRRENPKFRLNQSMSVAIYQALRDKKAGRRWETLVNFTLKDLIGHLENRFDKEMNWENYGSYWHIDHIKPRSLFNYIVPEDEEFKKCWALKNLQPLEKIANLRKGNTFIS